MKILYLNGMCPTPKAPTGGIFVTKRMEALRKLDMVDVIPVNFYAQDKGLLKLIKKILKTESPEKALTEQEGIQYINKEFSYHLFHSLMWFFSRKTAGKIISKKAGGMDWGEFDAIHVHWFWPHTGYVARYLSMERKIPYYITCHGSEINYALKDKKNRLEMISVLESASKVEFVSQKLLETAKSMGYCGDNAVVLNNGYDAALFNLTGRKVSDTFVVGYVGNVIPVKGSDRLPGIIKNVCSKCDNVKFLIVGDGLLSDSIRKELEGYPVDFVGRVKGSEVASYMKQLDVLLLPSRNEGFPCVVKEAQACGVPVVATDAGGIKEAVGEDGLTVSAGADNSTIEAEMAECVLDLLSRNTDRAEISKRAEKYSWTELQKKSVAMYLQEDKE